MLDFSYNIEFIPSFYLNFFRKCLWVIPYKVTYIFNLENVNFLLILFQSCFCKWSLIWLWVFYFSFKKLAVILAEYQLLKQCDNVQHPMDMPSTLLDHLKDIVNNVSWSSQKAPFIIKDMILTMANVVTVHTITYILPYNMYIR